VELKLLELDLHDVGAAVGKLEGLDVVVADTAKLVGKKVKVVLGRILDGQAFATLVDTTEVPTPITFESEAEKPTRAAPSRRKTSEEAAEAPVAAIEPIEQVETSDEAEDEAEADVGEAVSEDGTDAAAPARKRTRRGSRGGKRRKKAPAGAGAEDAAEPDGSEADVGEAAAEAAPEPVATPKPKAKPAAARKRTPKIHVPDTDAATEAAVDGDVPVAEPAAESKDAPEITSEDATTGDGDASAPKKRTRRGTRGGRSRKKKTAPANGDGAAPADAAETAPESDVEVAVTAPEPVEEPAPAGGYVPMSEWIEDFDRR
jgi:ribonuclease E